MNPYQPDPVPGRLAIGITLMVALAVLTPYVWIVPKDNMQLVIQAQTNLFAGWLMVVAFYYKARGDAVKDQTIAAQAETAKTAGAALASQVSAAAPTIPVAPGAAPTIPVAPGDKVTVEGTTPP